MEDCGSFPGAAPPTPPPPPPPPTKGILMMAIFTDSNTVSCEVEERKSW